MLLSVLRVLPLAAYAGVAAGLLRLRRSIPESPVAAGRTWRWLAWPYGAIAFNLVLFEIRHAVEPLLAGHPLAEFFGTPAYHSLYLAQAAIGACIPVTLLAILPRKAGWRSAARVAFGVIAVAVAVAVATGALPRWTTLLAWTRVIYYLAIGAHVLFWALLALGALHPVGRHLAAFVAFETMFTMLVPVQEAFFAVLGHEPSERIWHVNQILQVAAALGQTAVIVLWLRAGSPFAPVVAGGEVTSPTVSAPR